MKNFNFLNNAMQPLTVESFSFKFRSNFDFESRIRPRREVFDGIEDLQSSSFKVRSQPETFVFFLENKTCCVIFIRPVLKLIFSLHSPIFYIFIYFLNMFIKICCRFISTESKREWGVTSASSSDGDVYSHGGSFI